MKHIAAPLAVGCPVRVYPHGSPQQAHLGTVEGITLGRAIVLIRFDSPPPFAVTPPKSRVDQATGPILFVAYRLADWVPWIEAFGRGHYEIEPK